MFTQLVNSKSVISVHFLHLCFIAYNTVEVDYMSISSLLTFIPGGDKVLCIPVNITNDDILEGKENFDVVIDFVAPRPGVVEGPRDMATVFIEDNDGMLCMVM